VAVDARSQWAQNGPMNLDRVVEPPGYGPTAGCLEPQLSYIVLVVYNLGRRLVFDGRQV